MSPPCSNQVWETWNKPLCKLKTRDMGCYYFSFGKGGREQGKRHLLLILWRVSSSWQRKGYYLHNPAPFGAGNFSTSHASRLKTPLKLQEDSFCFDLSERQRTPQISVSAALYKHWKHLENLEMDFGRK